MIEKIKAALKFTRAFLTHAFELGVSVVVFIPLFHLHRLYVSPKDLIGTAILGPAEGMIRLLTRPKSLLFGLLLGSALYFGVPGLGLLLPIAAGVAANLLFSFAESVIIKMRNQEQYHQMLDDNDKSEGSAYGFHYISKGIRENIPNNLSPIGKALYFDYARANKWSGSSSFPYDSSDVSFVLCLSGWSNRRPKKNQL